MSLVDRLLCLHILLDRARVRRTASEAAAEIERLTTENSALRELVNDAIEDVTEFETEWNKAARKAINRLPQGG